MNSPRRSEDYKQRIAASFDQRSHYDDDYTRHRAIRLVRFAELAPGARVLDLATGTGIAAFAAAQDVGTDGAVLGVDISPGMLAQAREKLRRRSTPAVTVLEDDADQLDFPAASFDALLCSSSLMWFSDIPGALGKWYRWLVPGGTVAFSCYSESSFTLPIQIEVAAAFGHCLPNCNEQLGTRARCVSLLRGAGFGAIEFEAEDLGDFISTRDAKRHWPQDGNWVSPQGNPLAGLPVERLNELRAAYETRIDELAVDDQILQGIDILYVRAKK
jgi:ubiquinone/menaquinone biosynthesis C-methylase UbiE